MTDAAAVFTFFMHPIWRGMGLHNAPYHGPFVNKAREVFSNTGTANMNRWQTYVKGDPKRQDILETARV